MVLPMAFFMLYQTVFETNANVRMHIVVPRAVRELITRIGLLVVYLLYAFDVVNINGFVLALCGVYAIAMLCNMGYLFSLGKISLRPDWEKIKVDVMRTGLMLKFTDAALAEKLLATGDEELVEGNWWHDNTWGNCHCPQCSRVGGRNLLGMLLMEVRKELQYT
jgi:hypothetical protein